MKKGLWSLLLALLLLLWSFSLPTFASPDPGLIQAQNNTSESLAQGNCPRQLQSPIAPEPLSAAISINPEVLPRIGVARIRSGILPGVVIGGHHEGVLKILQQHYTASGQLDEQLEDAALQAIEDELVDAGYKVGRSEQHSLFDEQLMEESEPVRFLVGGKITKVELNSYSSFFNNRTADQRTIQWEIFDRDTNKVIVRQATTGQAEAEGIDNPAATYEAIRASFKTLLAQPSFTTSLQQAVGRDLAPTSAKTYQIAALPSSQLPLSTEQIASHTIPSVVWIRTPTGRGTGFVIDSSGLILTNQHVVGSSFSVKVKLYDGSTQTGRVLKRNAAFDVALVKLEGEVSNIPALPIADLSAVKVGEEVVAIGNPIAYSNTVTKGIVSGIRSIGNRDLIQTDVAINPGNSGGPLLNQQGAVIGIVTEKMVSRGIEGLGFALPISESLQNLDVFVKPSRSIGSMAM
ncbi:trypsin-like peptidase domain-containing protein [Trichocoleus sp. FACHB-591]|uniref:S1C family serine protease n=1 Tax=Trichocoleus sp. FACHB-591 TaxID=2692872 RepID=UPI001682523C|nr:trypsin-like peptidase domain-containing protein [Trichocoleus sp. FACHB-591]MBD2098177.1 trypsin-like peptidase domain-containing protein [Trichocoleus sp. FACHB-591]